MLLLAQLRSYEQMKITFYFFLFLWVGSGDLKDILMQGWVFSTFISVYIRCLENTKGLFLDSSLISFLIFPPQTH